MKIKVTISPLELLELFTTAELMGAVSAMAGRMREADQAGLGEEPSAEDSAFLARAKGLAQEAMAQHAANIAAAEPTAEEPKPATAEEPKRRRRTKAQIELDKLDGKTPPAGTSDEPENTTTAEEDFKLDDEPPVTEPQFTADQARAKVSAAMLADRAKTVGILKSFAASFGEIPADKYPELMEKLAWA